MEPPAETGAPTPIATFTGRAVPVEMGNVRLGGSGRPVTISLRASESFSEGRREPRVVLAPQPRSPFQRKIETSVSLSLSMDNIQPAQFQFEKTVVQPLEHVHTRHYPTHRTTVADAIRGTATVAVDKTQPPPKASKKRRTTAEQDASVKNDASATESTKSKTKRSLPYQTGRTATRRASHAPPLNPAELAMFTRKPQPTSIDLIEEHPFHRHERIPRSETVSAIARAQLDDQEPLSGWREVDDCIDHIYEDPSIDLVQFQLLHHGAAKYGEKRKAVERDRLHAAAAEVHKQKQGQLAKIQETQHRREQILKMSSEIRSRNRTTTKRTHPVVDPSAPVKRKLVADAPPPTRKPPVPRLSRLGGKAKTQKAIKPPNQDIAKASPAQSDFTESDAVAVDSDNRVQLNSDGRPSDSILLGHQQVTIPANSKSKKASATKKHRATKHSSLPENTTNTKQISSLPPAEKLQRRVLAREYMQIQKQTRLLLQAKMDEQKQMEEERRRLELQRLENTRLLELEEARKRRIRQKQRDRISLRMREEQERNDTKHASPMPQSDEVSHRQQLRDNESDTENQSIHGNDSSRPVVEASGFLWPDSYRYSSHASSPRLQQDSYLKELDVLGVGPRGEKLQKLQALEEQAKRLAEKLQSLSHRKPNRRPTSDDERIEHEAPSSQVSLDRPSIGGSDDQSQRRHSSDQDSVRYRSGSDSGGILDLDDADSNEYVSDGHSVTRVDREHFAFFNGRGAHNAAHDDQFDFTSVGIQKIQVMWPHDGQSDVDEHGQPSNRFEELPSSNSPSANSSSLSHEKRGFQLERGVWEQSDALADSNSAILSPKHLEESVDAYATRLLAQTARLQTSDCETDYRQSHHPAHDYNSPQRIQSKAWLRDAPPMVDTNQKQANADAELLRLIRESDDNLSVIDREAKRRFRLQQERLRQRRQEQERKEEEQFKIRLLEQAPPPNDTRVGSALPVEEGGDSVDMTDTPIGHVGELRYEKLDEILEAVQTTKHDTKSGEEGKRDDEGMDADDQSLESEPTGVSFWNSQLKPSEACASRKTPRVEIDRRHIHSQRGQQLNEENDGGGDDDGRDEHKRLLSPQTLANRLLAAVDYHEAIQDAHLQLSMMEKAHALEQVQQDTLALAQAFKEEMDSNYLAQQLEDEHTALESEFDANLQQVFSQLETVQEAEKLSQQAKLKQLEEDARVARRRESAVQTDEPHVTDAATSARLRVEAATVTESERLHVAVQHLDDATPANATADLVDAGVVHQRTDTSTSFATEESEDEYAEETFDHGSASGSVQVVVQSNHVSTMKDDDMESNLEVVSNESKPSPSSNDEIESEHENEDIVSVVNDQEIVSDDIQSEDLADDHSESSRERSSEIASEASYAERQTQSASAGYDDDGFEEEERSIATVESAGGARGKDNGDSKGEIDEAEAVSSTTSERENGSVSVGYEKEDFDDESSTHNENEVVSESNGNLDSDDEVSEVSDQRSSTDAGSVKSASIPSNDTFTHQQNLTPTVVQKSTPSEDRQTTQHAPIPAFASSIDNTRLTTAPTIPAAVNLAYLTQLENRKQSEQALLDIRLQALESKVEQNMQHVMRELSDQSRLVDPTMRSELELRRDALHMMFLSEKANIESQKSACVSRYFQDLLAFRSLGVMPMAATAMSFSPTIIDSSKLPVTQSFRAKQVHNPLPATDQNASVSEGYANDEFNDEVVASKDASSDADSYSDDVEKDASQSIEEATENEAISSLKKNSTGDFEDEINEVESINDNKSANSDVEDAPKSDEDDSIADYGDEDFASVSESRDDDKHDQVDDAASIQSSQSAMTEPTAAIEENEVAQADDDVYEDEFASASEIVAAVDDGNTSMLGNDVDKAVTDDEDPVGEVIPVLDRSEDVSADEVDGDDVVSIVDGAVQEEQQSVSQEGFIPPDVVVDRDGGGNVEDDGEQHDSSFGEYDDDFASVSEAPDAQEDHKSITEDAVDDEYQMNSASHVEGNLSDPAETDAKEASAELYAEDDFEESSEDTATSPTHVAVSSRYTPSLASEHDDDREEADNYSDEIEPNDILSPTAEPRSDASEGEGDNPADVHPKLIVEVVNAAPNAIEQYDDQLFVASGAPDELFTSTTSVQGRQTQMADEDATVRPTPLADSLSASHLEETLTTASMEEQLKRIDDLKCEIELRKEAFSDVQKKLRVEKKKERLREAETQLWTEMEQLETQLVIDERILAISKQRGRLESMDLEARHYSLQHRGALPGDLLEGYDYCEDVKPLKSPVAKQDHEAQVRLPGPPHHLLTATLPYNTYIETDRDMLIAYDFVEAAELPVMTIATNTESAATRSRGRMERFETIVEAEPSHAAFDELDVEEQVGDPSTNQPHIDAASSLSQCDTVPVSDAGPRVAVFESIAVKSSTETDLLASYDYAEDVEPLPLSIDLLEVYDHVEEVELVASTGDAGVATSEPRVLATEETSDKQPQERNDLDDEGFEDNLDIDLQMAASDETKDAPVPAGAAEEHADSASTPATDLNEHEEEHTGIEAERDEMSDFDDSVDEEQREDEEGQSKSSAPADHNFDAFAPSDPRNVVEKVDRITQALLDELLRGSVFDIVSITSRSAQRSSSCEKVNLSILPSPFTSHQEPQLNPVEPTRNEIDDDGMGDLSTDGDHEQAEFLVDPSTSDQKTGQRVSENEIQTETIVDHLFEGLVAASIRSGVALEAKGRARSATANPEKIHASNQRVSQSTPPVQPTQLQLNRAFGSSIVHQLRVSSSGVVVPRLHEFGVGQGPIPNGSAIYGAVNELAMSQYEALMSDPLFCQKTNRSEQDRMLIDRVERRMEESVWSLHTAACEELDRFARKMQEEEQGELDDDDLRLLQAQQRFGVSGLVASHLQASVLRDLVSERSVGVTTTPRQRRRVGSASSIQRNGTRDHVSILLEHEEDQLVDNVTKRLLDDLVAREIATLRR